MNGWLPWIIGFLASLMLGSYAYTWTATSRLDDTIINRLDRIEQKVDCLGNKLFCK